LFAGLLSVGVISLTRNTTPSRRKFAPQQRVQPPVAKAPTLLRQGLQSLAQFQGVTSVGSS
jgi:hypothetical protein